MNSNTNFKGITYSVVIIVALVGIMGALIGMGYQSSVGSGFGSTIIDKSAQDASIQKLEITKETISGALKFSSMSSALDVAIQGGTADPITYWECDGNPQPPELNEVLFAISNMSTQYLNAYLKELKEQLKEKNISVSECDCATVTPPMKEICMNEDCAYFGSGAKNEKIDVSFPTDTSYVGDIEADNSPIRFFMFYFRLYDFFKENKLLTLIPDSMKNNCPEPVDVKYEIAYKDVCRELIKELSRHDAPKDPINCETIVSGEHPEILCTHKYINCRILETGAPHTGCERVPKEELCFQGDKQGILIELKDKKFKPLGAKYMIWNLNAVFTGAAIPECVPIDEM